VVRWEVRGERVEDGVVVLSGGVTGWRVMKCSGVAVLVADLVTQLPELVNLADERGGGLRNLILRLPPFSLLTLAQPGKLLRVKFIEDRLKKLGWK